MLVVGEGILQKVPKLLKHVDNLGIDGWEWLEELKDKESSGANGEGTDEKVQNTLRTSLLGDQFWATRGGKVASGSVTAGPETRGWPRAESILLQ